MYGQYFLQNDMVDQPGIAAIPARGQLNRENIYSPVPVRAREFGLTRRVRPSRPASACSFSTLRPNIVLTHGIPRDFCDGVHIDRHSTSGQSRICRVTQLRTDGVHCRQSAGTGPVVLKAVPVTGAAFSGFTKNQLMFVALFPRPLLILVCMYVCMYVWSSHIAEYGSTG